ncbi:cupin domain-containing protein (plasmid) [Haloferacaceae archaeon DSL9]
MVRDYVASEIPAVYGADEIPPARDEPGFRQIVFRGIDQMIGFATIGPEREEKPPHSHPWEQTNLLIEGELDFIVGDERVSLRQYDMLTIPPGIEHTSRSTADEPATLLAVWPLREDRLKATSYQAEFNHE